MKISIKKIILRIFLLLIVASGGYYLYLNPQLFEKFKFPAQSDMPQNYSEINALQNQIYELKLKIAELPSAPDFSSKADADVVLSLVARINKIEEKLEKVSEATDNNALILTATMMLKNTAETGETFVPQAELVSQLSSADAKLSQDIKIIEEIAPIGVKTNVALAKEFNVVYDELLTAQKQAFEATWKGTIQTKLDEFVKVRKINKKAPEFRPNEVLEKAKYFADNHEFNKALEELQNIGSDDLLQINEKLSPWRNNVLSRQKLFNAINNIVSNSLVTMKVASITKE